MDDDEAGLFGFALPLHGRAEGEFSHGFQLDNQLDDDVLLALEMNHKITWYGITPMTVIGVLSNCLVLWVWNFQRNFQVCVFLFKTLAVLDTMYIFFFNMWWYSETKSVKAFILKGVTFGTQYMSVNTSLMVVACRWLVVYKPALSQKLLTRFRVRLAVGIIVGWCATLKFAVERLFTALSDDREATLILNVTAAQLMLTLPLLVQAVLTASLVWAMYGERKVHSGVSSAEQEHADTDEPEWRGSNSSKVNESRRLNYTVICITTMSFLAYPIEVVTIGYFKLTTVLSLASVKRIVFASFNLLQITNSSINFFIYLAFIPNFKKLLVLKFISEDTARYHTLADSGIQAANPHADARPQLSNSPIQPPFSFEHGDRSLSVIAEVPQTPHGETRSPTVMGETEGELPPAAAAGEEATGEEAEGDQSAVDKAG